LIPTEISPYALMQEEFRNEPWKLLVGCILLNQVSAKVAKPIWQKFFEMYPTAQSLHDAPTSTALADMTVLFRPLGFQNRRATRVLCMTGDFLKWDGNDPLSLYGVGKYAADSYNMFIKGEIVPDVKDKELRNYVEWASKYPNGQEAQHRL
jgi:methyl-CpG-binding domain protein 4